MRYLALFFLCFMSLISSARPSISILPDNNHDTTIKNSMAPLRGGFTDWLNMKPRDIAKLTGQKFNWKEKLAISFVQHRLKKQAEYPKANPSNGQTSFLLGLLSLIFLFVPILGLASIPLAILAIVIGAKAKKNNPNDRKAKTGIILGIVTLALIVFAIFLLIILLSSAGWYF